MVCDRCIKVLKNEIEAQEIELTEIENRIGAHTAQC
jgi:hypothetical protein